MSEEKQKRSKGYERQNSKSVQSSEMSHKKKASRQESIELLSPKQNGTVEAQDRQSKSTKSANIKGMWRKAFKTLKTTGNENDKEGASGGRSFSRLSFKKLRKRDDSREEDPDTPDPNAAVDPAYSLLKCAASLSKGGRHCCGTGDGRPHRHHHTHGDEQGSQSSLGVNKQSSRSPSPSSGHDHRRDQY